MADGYSNYYFTGTTSLELAKFVLRVIENPEFSGLINFGGERISKYELLKKISRIYDVDIKVTEKNTGFVDRSLALDKLNDVFNYTTRDWDIVLRELKEFYKR